MLVVYVFVICVTAIFSWKVLQIYHKIIKDRSVIKKIPAPPENLLTGHVYVFMQNPNKIFTTIRKLSEKYYPIYRLSNFHINVVSFLDPNDIEIVLSSTRHLSKSIIYSFLHNWLGTGLLTSSGAKWHKRRKILTPAFHFGVLQQFLQIFNDETANLLEKLSEANGKIINVVPLVTNFTLQSITETAMGLENINESSQIKYKEAINQIGGILLKRLSKPWFRFNSIYCLSKLFREENELVKILHDFSRSIIREREQEMSGVCDLLGACPKKRLAMLDLLLSARRRGADIDYEGIREEVDTFMFEGHDTTAMAISYLLLVLANLQEIQAEVLNEILAVIGPTKAPTYEDLQELKFTERCIKETLRLFPSVATITRVSSEDFMTKTGHKIPKNVPMNIHIFDLHRDERLYADPLRFDPDRFLPENVAARHPFAYLPFSAGPRNCIGQKFALLEMKSVLCGILRGFKLEKVISIHDVGFTMNMVLQPLEETPIKIKIVRRDL